MKRNPFIIPLFINLGILAMAIIVAPLTGCKTAGVYDPAKTARLEKALQPIVTDPIILVIRNNQSIKTNLGDYFRTAGSTFKEWTTTTNISVDDLILTINQKTAKLQENLPVAAIMAKEAILSGFELLTEGVDIKLNPERAPIHAANIFYKGIDRGLTSSGLPGVP